MSVTLADATGPGGGASSTRAGRGPVREGPGDLIGDRLEFDPEMRAGVVDSDLAFRAMDLERLAAR